MICLLIHVLLFQISPPLFCKEYYDKYFPQIISHSHFFSALKKQLPTEVSLQVKHYQEACQQPAMDGMGQELANSPLVLIPLFPTTPTDFLLLPTLSPGHLLSPNTGTLLENSLICSGYCIYFAFFSP